MRRNFLGPVGVGDAITSPQVRAVDNYCWSANNEAVIRGESGKPLRPGEAGRSASAARGLGPREPVLRWPRVTEV